MEAALATFDVEGVLEELDIAMEEELLIFTPFEAVLRLSAA